MTKKPKTYVVFSGIEPGIYKTWAECQANTKGVKGAKYKSYESAEEAREEFDKHRQHEDIPQSEIDQSISTDASCTGKSGPGETEYRVVYTVDEKPIYESKVYPWGTNNLGEFLALVKGMQHLFEKGEKNKIIFTDSMTAMSWVKKKAINSSLERDKVTEELYKEVDRALGWLKTQDVKTYNIWKWEKGFAGEIKADFGRK